MAQMTSGKVLRETRERKGYELDTVARRLRIRPDILRAIEAGDFDAMPPRGYTRNMVNAYARLLGLNPTEIVNMYLDEVYAHQVERARGNSPSGFNMDRDPRRSRARNRAMRYDDWDSRSSSRSRTQSQSQSRGSSYRHTGEGGMNSFLTRDLYDDRTEFSRDDYGITRERRERPDRSERDFMSHHSGYSEMGYGYLSQTPRRGNRDIHVGQTPMEYKASRIPSFLQSRLVLIIIAIIVVAIIAVAAFTLLNRGSQTDENDVSQLPVSGINDTTKSEEDEEEEAAIVEVAPTSARVVYSVKSGEDCYIETYLDDGDVQPEMLSGPTEKTLEVTGTWTITTWSPDTISISVDGSPITLSIDNDRGGMYAYTVDFPAILEQWRQTHPSKSEQRSAAVASASNATDTSPDAEESASAESASEGSAAA